MPELIAIRRIHMRGAKVNHYAGPEVTTGVMMTLCGLIINKRNLYPKASSMCKNCIRGTRKHFARIDGDNLWR